MEGPCLGAISALTDEGERLLRLSKSRVRDLADPSFVVSERRLVGGGAASSIVHALTVVPVRLLDPVPVPVPGTVHIRYSTAVPVHMVPGTGTEYQVPV